jgi:hypothetical protein
MGHPHHARWSGGRRGAWHLRTARLRAVWVRPTTMPRRMADIRVYRCRRTRAVAPCEGCTTLRLYGPSKSLGSDRADAAANARSNLEGYINVFFTFTPNAAGRSYAMKLWCNVYTPFITALCPLVLILLRVSLNFWRATGGLFANVQYISFTR